MLTFAFLSLPLLRKTDVKIRKQNEKRETKRKQETVFYVFLRVSLANIGKFKLSLKALILSVFTFICFLVFSNAFRRTKIFCSSCSSIMAKESQYALPDGRYLCSVCRAQVISQPDQILKIKKLVINRLIDEGVRFQEKRLESVPIEIVNVNRLAQLRNQPPSITQKGLTLTRSEMTLGGKLFGSTPKMSHHIYILDNLIKIEFAGTLAHEIMHVWQNENQIKLAAPQCEGLCNLGSWLAYNTIKSSKTPYFLKVMQENPDPVYGDGFRHVYSKYQQVGWEGVLQLARSGQL